MDAAIVQADYAALQRIAATLTRLHEQSEDLRRRLAQGYQPLADGGWEGRGAAAFQAEMQQEVFPTVDRLIYAFAQAHQVTLRIHDLMRTAEEQAANRMHEIEGGGASIGAGTQLDQQGSTPGAVLLASIGAILKNKNFEKSLQLFAMGKILTPNGLEDYRESKKLKLKYAFWKAGTDGDFGEQTLAQGQSSIGGTSATGSVGVAQGNAEAGVSAEFGKDGKLGVYAEAYLGKAEAEGVIGDQDFGLTGSGEVHGPGAGGFAGIRDGSLGAEIGVSLATAKGEVGFNIAGFNIGLQGEAGLKAEAGFAIGRTTQIKLPFFSFGITFGGAKDGSVNN